MVCFAHSSSPGKRPAMAAVELAIFLPFLVFIFLIAVDFSRVFYDSLTITNCARNGAVFASRVNNSQSWQDGTALTSIQQAALADGANLNPPLTNNNVTVAWGLDADGNSCVTVTVSYTFQTIADFPGIPNSTNLVRKVQMRVAPQYPN
jgi:Flp pilus assembly protein TadG